MQNKESSVKSQLVVFDIKALLDKDIVDGRL